MLRDRLAALALAGVAILIVDDGNQVSKELKEKLAAEDIRVLGCGDAADRALGRLRRHELDDLLDFQLSAEPEWLEDGEIFRADRSRLNELASDALTVLMKCSATPRRHTPMAHHKCSRLRYRGEC